MKCLNTIYKLKIGDRIESFTEDQLVVFLQMRGIKRPEQLKRLEFIGMHSLSREDIVDKIDQALKNKVYLESAEIPGDDYRFTDGSITVCQYLDQYGVKGWDGQPKIAINMLTNKEQFSNYVQAALINTEGMSEEQSKKEVERIIDLWSTIKVDAVEFHRFFTYLFTHRNLLNSDVVQLESELKRNFPLIHRKLKNGIDSTTNTLAIQALAGTMNAIASAINTQLCGHKTERFKGSVKYNVTFAARIKGCDQPVRIHIDQMYVDDYGRIHIFNFKVAQNDSRQWAINKDLKYTYEMALLKRILAANGIPVERTNIAGQRENNIELYNIPVILSYNEDGSVINSVSPNQQQLITYSIRNDKPYLQKYEEQIKELIDVEEDNTQEILLDQDLQRADEIIRLILPQYDAKAKGLQVSAKTWIREHYNSGDIHFDEATDEWVVQLSKEKEFRTRNPAFPTNNEDIMEYITKNLDLIQEGKPVVIQSLVQEIINNYHVRSGFQNRMGFRFSAEYADQTFAMYLNQNSEGEHDWQFLKNDKLFACGILLFKNKKTGQIDVIIPSAFEKNSLIQFPKKERENILGHYVNDIDSPTRMRATYGNIEKLRAIAVLNEIMPNLMTEGKLGAIKVITPFNGGDGLVDECKNVVYEYNKIIAFLKKNVENIKDYRINFKVNGFVDSFELIQTLTDSFINGTEISLNTKRDVVNSLGLSGFENFKTKEAQAVKLQEVVNLIEEKYGKNRDQYIQKSRSSNPRDKFIGELYLECIKTINRFNGMYEIEVKKINTIERLILPQYANPDQNVRHIANLYSRALDEIAVRFQKDYDPIRSKVLKFYDKVGYGAASSFLKGSAEQVYDKMFERNAQTGKRTWNFIDPYSDIAQRILSKDEIDFLKFALFQFAKIKARRNNLKFDFYSENDPKLKSFIYEHAKDWYFKVPLERGSSAHQTRNGLWIPHIKREIKKMKQFGVMNYAKQRIEERESQSSTSDYNGFEESISHMKTTNILAVSMDSGDARRRMLNRHEDSYWETNIEYLLADYVEKQIATEELEKVAFYGKCLLTEMTLLGSIEGENSQRLIKKSMEEIEKYLKLNVFGKSIMENFSQQIMEFITPTKRLMSHLFIAGNLRSAFRDTFEGVWQNFARTVSKYQTNLNADSITDGYKKVIQDIFHSDRDINIMSELCLRYRLSNTDAARIAERAKTGRGGIFDPSQWAYSTMRGPDFLNRMTLFVARCLQDGVWDAFSIDKETQALKYDWKLDKRFSIFASGDTKNPEYKMQKALYYTAVKTYNAEHPNNTITFNGDETPLPEPYSQNEIRQFKMFADGIYGAYDKSQKPMYENIALGQTLGVFTTWMNGQAAAYFRKPGQYAEYFTTKDKDGNYFIKKDNFSGNELWFDDNGNIIERLEDGTFIDENGNEVKDENDLFAPVIDKVPVPVQGIFYTCMKSLKIIASVANGDHVIERFKEEVWNNPYERANLNKLFLDMLIWCIFALIFKQILDPKYKEYQKNKNEDDVLENMMVELLYRSSSNSYEGFKGIKPMYDYIFNDISPSTVNVSFKVVSDGVKTVFGDKTWDAFVYNNVPVFRTFKETAKKLNAK